MGGVSDTIVRATAVGRDAELNAERDMVLAGDPKVFRLLCNTNLNMNIYVACQRGTSGRRVGSNRCKGRARRRKRKVSRRGSPYRL